MKPIVGAVLLDARQDVASARDKVIRSGLSKVVIRRTEGLVVFWYTFDTQYVLARFQAHDDRASVEQALDLHESAAAIVREIETVDSAPPIADAVILDGPRFIGVWLAAAKLEVSLLAPEMATETPSPRSVSSPSPLRRMMRRFRTLGTQQESKEIDFPGGPSSARSGPPVGSAPATSPTIAKTIAAFTTYPRLDAPSMVTPCEQFTITIGFAPQSQPGTVGGPFTVELPSAIKRFTLDILIVADGFGMPAGGRHRLEVDRGDPYAHPIFVPLIAPESVDDVLLTTISVIYFFDKVPCGTAARKIAVIPVGRQPFSDTHGTGTLWTASNEPSGTVTIQPGIPAVDLTVTISKPDANPSSGQFVWSFESPHDVKLPDKPLTKDLGMDTQQLGTRIIEGIQNAEAQDMVALEIGGLGKDIANKMPLEFWSLLRDVTKIVNTTAPGRFPTVLFLTAEAHVPWELALVSPPLDDKAPPYLACQIDMARWPLSDSGMPCLPPAASIDVHQFTVVVGDYAARSGWRELKKAEEECSTIVSRHGAIRVIAEPPQIKQLLTMTGGATGSEAVHFACHGEATAGHVLDAAIILGQGQRMSPTWLANAPLGKKNRPFLFLNACQVGKAGELLGSFSGFAGESLKGGFRGFIAPLWSVDDGLARDIAVKFYDRVFGNGGTPPEPVASVLRSLRRDFSPDTEKHSATRLAYVFYGHPGLIMRLRKES